MIQNPVRKCLSLKVLLLGLAFLLSSIPSDALMPIDMSITKGMAAAMTAAARAPASRNATPTTISKPVPPKKKLYWNILISVQGRIAIMAKKIAPGKVIRVKILSMY